MTEDSSSKTRPPETDETEERKPKIQVIDRRFWARPDEDDERGSDEADDTKPTYVAALEGQLAELKKQLDSVRSQYREAKSEFENARARLRRDLSLELEMAKRSLLQELISVLDDLDRAVSANPETAEGQALLEGVSLVRGRFLRVLGGLGVTRLRSEGELFNPKHHEAISTLPVSDPAQDNRVVGVVKEAYLIGEETLRPGQVAVGKLHN